MARINLPSKFSISAKRPKFNNRIVEYHGWKFHSQLECDYYKYLQALLSVRRITLLLRQVPLLLAPGSRLVVDFVVQWSEGGALEFHDTKGYMTANAKTKIKLAEHLYGIKIHIVERGDF